MSPEAWTDPLVSRYASPEMAALFSPRHRAILWRRLWLALAEQQAALGLPISSSQLSALRRTLDRVDLEAVARHEAVTRHDVMAHIHAWGEQAPEARPILHLGATSCYVTDNADVIVQREALDLLLPRLAAAVDALAAFAERHAELPVLGLTHLQPAQLTTAGKRACLWIQDLLMDLEDLQRRRQELRFRGVKGTTGTQASYLALFGGDAERVEELDRRVCAAFGFEESWPVTGQTAPRKAEHRLLSALSGVGVSAHKLATDLRLLASRKEVEEPFGRQQVGSSAMAYKRNPMRCERVCALSRLLVHTCRNAADTAMLQWMERTLDDSANRRIAIPTAFLAADAVATLVAGIAGGLVVHPRVVARHVSQELPFMATEELLMEMVLRGADRQETHEAIRRHAMAASARVKDDGLDNDLVERLAADPCFRPIHDRLDRILAPERFVGLAARQVRRFLAERVRPALEPWRGRLCPPPEPRV